nr:tyrosine-type recombinase/integrase [Exilibacterium tricleocarpae]
MARFVSADPVIDGVTSTQGYNRYAYVHNNPLAFTDPSGFSRWNRFRDQVLKPVVAIAVAYYFGPESFKWFTAGTKATVGALLYNPASQLELPKMERRLPKATLSPEEVDIILSQPNTLTPEGLRDRTILEVLYSTGIRRMECVNLQKADLNASQGVLAVRQGKGKKDRFVPIGERAIEWLQTYLEDTRPGFVVEPDSQQVFIESNGLPLTPDRLSRLVAKYIKQGDIGKTGSCHLFRHTVATLMLDNGADIRFIQQMLGHAHLATTEIYTHVSIVKLKQIYNVTHPAKRAVRPNRQDEEVTEEELLAALEAENDNEK